MDDSGAALGPLDIRHLLRGHRTHRCPAVVGDRLVPEFASGDACPVAVPHRSWGSASRVSIGRTRCLSETCPDRSRGVATTWRFERKSGVAALVSCSGRRSCSCPRSPWVGLAGACGRGAQWWAPPEWSSEAAVRTRHGRFRRSVCGLDTSSCGLWGTSPSPTARVRSEPKAHRRPGGTASGPSCPRQRARGAEAHARVAGTSTVHAGVAHLLGWRVSRCDGSGYGRAWRCRRNGYHRGGDPTPYGRLHRPAPGTDGDVRVIRRGGPRTTIRVARPGGLTCDHLEVVRASSSAGGRRVPPRWPTRS